jgi:hypothetical protein
VTSRPEFYRVLFSPQKFLTWEKKNQPPPKQEVPPMKNKFRYCTKNELPYTRQNYKKRRNDYRNKFCYSTPLPEKEIIIRSYNIKMKERIPSFKAAKLLIKFRDEIFEQIRSYQKTLAYDEFTEHKKWKNVHPEKYEEDNTQYG